MTEQTAPQLHLALLHNVSEEERFTEYYGDRQNAEGENNAVIVSEGVYLVDKSNTGPYIEYSHDLFKGQEFSSIDEGLQALRDACHDRGFAVKKRKFNQGKNGTAVRYCKCSRWGKQDNRGGSANSRRQTRLTNCEWQAELRQGEDGKVIITSSGTHNHPPSFDISADPNARQYTPEQLEYARALIRVNQKPSQIIKAMRLKFGTNCKLIEKDITNLKQKEKKRLLVSQDDTHVVVSSKIEYSHDLFKGKAFNSIDEGLQALRDACHERGFAIKKRKLNQGKNGTAVRYCKCSRWGKQDNRGGSANSRRQTRLTNCEWQAELRQGEDGKVIITSSGTHNHPPSFDISADPNARQYTPEQLEYARTLIRVDQKPSQIIKAMRLRFGTNCKLIEKDITNLKQKEKKRLLVRQDDTHVVVSSIVSSSIEYSHDLFEGQEFSSIDEGLQALRDACHERGFAVKKRKLNQGKNGTAVRYCKCSRWGKQDDRGGSANSCRRSRLTNCEWQAELRQGEDGKVIITSSGTHNHPPSFDISADPNARQYTPEQLEYARTLIRVDQKPSQIIEAMKLKFGTNCKLIEKDITNLKQKEKKRLLVGQDDMGAFHFPTPSRFPPHESFPHLLPFRRTRGGLS